MADLKTVLYSGIFLVAGLAVFLGPALLVHESLPDAPECVIVMLGKDMNCRFRGAEQLAVHTHARALLVPAHFAVVSVREGGLGEKKRIPVKPVIVPPLKIAGHRFRIFENTHLELILGKRIMDRLGFHSAVIVSSPYHMRRLQLIALKVFDSSYTIGFKPTPFEEYDTTSCLTSEKCRYNVWNEYLKIVWFLIYSWFV